MTDPDEWDQESGQLGVEDTLDDRGVVDPLDEGVSPAERPWIGGGWGVTAREEATGEPLDGRLARELPDGAEDDGDGLGDASDTDGELWDDEVGEVRAGRLLARDGGGRRDRDSGPPTSGSTGRAPRPRRRRCTSSATGRATTEPSAGALTFRGPPDLSVASPMLRPMTAGAP